MSVATERSVRVTVADGIAIVTLDRPPVNVLSTAMLADLDTTLGELATIGDLRLIVLRGAGRVFSAGVEVSEHLGDALGPMLDAFLAVSLRLAECDVPTLAVVHGVALGGGAELAALCDLAIAADDAKIGTPEISLGVVPPVGAAVFPTRVGWSRARALVLTGEPVSGADAAAWGLVWRSVPAEQLDATVASVMARFRSLSAASLRLAKRTLRVAAAVPDAPGAIRAADREQRESLPRTRDADEGLRSFVEKRAPRWQHR